MILINHVRVTMIELKDIFEVFSLYEKDDGIKGQGIKLLLILLQTTCKI